MTAYVVTHPEVVVDPDVPVPQWGLSEAGRARLRHLVALPWARSLTRVVSSDEVKAQTAEVLAVPLGLPVVVDLELGENDRSATGFVPPVEFELLADAFFAEPDVSVRGWERAVDAQARVVAAVERAVTGAEGDVAVLAHGGVGTLLWCHLAGAAVDRRHDQPGQGQLVRLRAAAGGTRVGVGAPRQRLRVQQSPLPHRRGCMRRTWQTVGVLAAVVLSGCSGTGTDDRSGTSVTRVELYDSMAALAGASGAVVVGTVGEQRTAADIARSDLPFHLSEVAVDDVLRGEVRPGSAVVVRETDGLEVLRPGGTYLLYLVPSGLPGELADQFYVTGASAGIYEREGSGEAFERVDTDSGDDLPASTTLASALG